MQARLLEVWPTTFSASSVRIITSSTQRLDAEFLVEKFAPELACRLSPLVIELPPLRRRGDDLLLLAQHFLEARNREAEAQVTGWDAEVAQQWLRYRWPGNLDELREVINEAHAASQDGLVHVAQLPFRFRAGVEAQRLTPSRRQTRPLDELLERVEREELETALQEAGGQMTRAAELLKIPRARLYRRLEQLGLRTGESTAPPLDSSPESG